MSSYRHRDDEFSGRRDRRSFRPPPPQDYHDRSSHNSPPSAPSARQYRGGASPRRHGHSPHDRDRTPPPSLPRGLATRNDAHNWEERRDSGPGEPEDGGRYRRDRSPQSSSRWSARRGGYRDRDREDYRSPEYESQSRSESRSRSPNRRRDRSQSRNRKRSRSPHQYYGGQPSREVMMDDVPLDMVEEDVSRELKRYCKVEDLEDVRIIRDKQTKASRGFGFLRFSSLESSRAFMEQNFPTIYFHRSQTANGDEQAAKVRVAYSRERDERIRAERGEVEWKCQICTFSNFPGRKVCFKCHNPYEVAYSNPLQAKQSEFANSGDSDASPNGAPSQFLLVRGLEPSVSEELLAKGVQKMYKPSSSSAQAAAVGSKKGPAKVASTTGDANLGAKEGTLRRVMLVRDRSSNESWRYGFAEFASVEDAQAALTRYHSFEKFTISSKQVVASFVHAGVFVPVFDSIHADERFTFASAANASVQLQYWDQNAFTSELVLGDSTDQGHVSAVGPAATKSARHLAAAAAEKEGLMSKSEDAETKTKKRKAEAKDAAKAKKPLPAHLQFWSNRHAELHGIQPENPRPDQPFNLDTTQADNDAKKASVDSTKPSTLSYADPKKFCCYLCSRQFKSEIEVNKHERLSQLHRDNLQKEELVSKGLAKLAKAGITSPRLLEDSSGSGGPEYRDRARERRAAFGGPAKISLSMKKSAQSPPLPSGKGETTESTAGNAEASPPATQSKGASLLGKMGWAAGEGLGARGTGMTAPIATDMYVAGVGLGAQGGKMGDAVEEAGKATKENSYGEFVERAKEKAKERFEQMS